MPKSNLQKISIKQVAFQIGGYVLAFSLLWWLFAVKLPEILSFQDVISIINQLTFAQNCLLVAAGLLLMLVLGWTSKSTLPGISLTKATQASAAAQVTSVVLPAPLDLLMRLTMYKSYGFSTTRSTAAVVVAGLVRYFALVAIPIAGILAMLITRQATGRLLFYGAIALCLVGIAAYTLRKVITSTAFANTLAKKAQKIVNTLLVIFKRKPTKKVEATILTFTRNSGDVLLKNMPELSWSHAAWGASQYLILLLTMRFCGIDASVLSWAEILLLTGVFLLLNSVPLIPGGIGFSEAILLTYVSFTSDYLVAAFASALLLYRAVTWLLPIPVGGLAFLWWRWQQKKPSLAKT